MTQRFAIECEGAQHTLELDSDDLRMLDHDVDSEKVLAAMGAATPFCIRAVDAWRNYAPKADDPRQLIAVADQDLLSERGREQVRRQVEYAEAHVEVMARRRTRSTELWARQREKALPNERFSAMLRLPEELRRGWLERFLREAEAAWADRAEGAEPTPVELLLMLACEHELAKLGGRADKKLWWNTIAPGAEPLVLGEAPSAPGVKMVGVPLNWLRERWLAGDTVKDGRLLLAPDRTLDFDEFGAPVMVLTGVA